MIGSSGIGRAAKDRELLHSEPIPPFRWRRHERGQGRSLRPKRGVDLIAAEERDAEARHAAESKAQPLCEIANAYLESVKRLRSWRDIESRIRCHIIPRLGHKQIGEITRADVVEFLDGLERKLGLRHQVNRCRETLRAIFAFAIERDQIAVNPILGVAKRKVEIPRDRTLNDDELTAIWRAIEELPDLQRAYFRVVLLTGARRNEVREMAWSELDLNSGLWRLPAERNKSARPFEIPLSGPVVDTLRRLPRVCPLVFALDGKRPITLHPWIERVVTVGPQSPGEASVTSARSQPPGVPR